MLTLEEIQKRLSDRKLGVVATATGLHYNTLREMRDNPQANPTHRVLRAISEYLEGNS